MLSRWEFTLIMFPLVVFTFEDISIPSGIWALSWAALATVFSATTVFIWRPGLPRIVMALFTVSMASHILEQFVAFSAQQLRLAALCRITVSVALVLPVWRDG